MHTLSLSLPLKHMHTFILSLLVCLSFSLSLNVRPSVTCLSLLICLSVWLSISSFCVFLSESVYMRYYSLCSQIITNWDYLCQSISLNVHLWSLSVCMSLLACMSILDSAYLPLSLSLSLSLTCLLMFCFVLKKNGRHNVWHWRTKILASIFYMLHFKYLFNPHLTFL